MSQIQRKWIADNAVNGQKARLDNSQYLRARNAADSGDLNLLKANLSDEGEFGLLTSHPFTPTNANHIANKGYVDAAVAGMRDVKDSVRVASTANVNIASAPASIDGVTLSSGDRVLLKNQTTASENGIYVFNGVGVAMTRSADFDGTPSGEVTQGAFTWSVEGTANARKGWLLTTADPITVGTTALTFVETPIPATIFTWEREQFTLTLSQISSGVTLAQTPVTDSVDLKVSGAGEMIYGTDYSVSGTLLTFSLPMQAILEAGDVIEVQYQY